MQYYYVMHILYSNCPSSPFIMVLFAVFLLPSLLPSLPLFLPTFLIWDQIQNYSSLSQAPLIKNTASEFCFLLCCFLL